MRLIEDEILIMWKKSVLACFAQNAESAAMRASVPLWDWMIGSMDWKGTNGIPTGSKLDWEDWPESRKTEKKKNRKKNFKNPKGAGQSKLESRICTLLIKSLPPVAVEKEKECRRLETSKRREEKKPRQPEIDAEAQRKATKEAKEDLQLWWKKGCYLPIM